MSKIALVFVFFSPYKVADAEISRKHMMFVTEKTRPGDPAASAFLLKMTAIGGLFF
jgi:hypothetical protein